jgi:hypothetical protein
MADAIVVGGIRAIVIIPGKSGLAKDVFVNSFAFLNAASAPVDDTVRNAVTGALASFYNVGASGINPLSSYIGQYADRGTNKCLVKTYDMGETSPRTPLIGSFTLGAMGSGGGPIPNEVAVCLSFKSTEVKGPRGRGRVFVGPLNGATVHEEDDLSIRPLLAFRNSLLHAGTALRDSSATTGANWCIYSSFGPDHMHPVTSVWVDNEFDTIRKRGESATSRVSA